MEVRFFEEGTIPVWTTPEWYAGVERAPHLEQEGHRGRLLLAASFVEGAVRDHGVRSVSDLGCGDGGLLSLIDRLSTPDGAVVHSWGYDLQPANVAAAVEERGVRASLADVVAGWEWPGLSEPSGEGLPIAWGDLAVCTEMLEHLVDPHDFVSRIESRVVVASSPDGETEDCHYAHHTWGFDMEGYRAMFERGGWTVVRHETIGFQVLMAVRS